MVHFDWINGNAGYGVGDQTTHTTRERRCMNKTSLGGLVLTGLGIVFLVLGRTEFERREEVLRLGDFRATVPTKRTVPAFRYLGVALLGGGVVLLIMGFRQPGQ